jgi:hypothetical protein
VIHDEEEHDQLLCLVLLINIKPIYPLAKSRNI